MIFSENRRPLFRIMLWDVVAAFRIAVRSGRVLWERRFSSIIPWSLTGEAHVQTTYDHRQHHTVFNLHGIGASPVARGNDRGAQPGGYHEAARALQGAAAGHSARLETHAYPGSAR